MQRRTKDEHHFMGIPNLAPLQSRAMQKVMGGTKILGCLYLGRKHRKGAKLGQAGVFLQSLRGIMSAVRYDEKGAAGLNPAAPGQRCLVRTLIG